MPRKNNFVDNKEIVVFAYVFLAISNQKKTKKKTFRLIIHFLTLGTKLYPWKPHKAVQVN